MDRRRLAGLLFFLLLFIAALIVTQKVRNSSALQDCVASGRRDCVAIPDATQPPKN